jgi:hypothetical protein
MLTRMSASKVQVPRPLLRRPEDARDETLILLSKSLFSGEAKDLGSRPKTHEKTCGNEFVEHGPNRGQDSLSAGTNNQPERSDDGDTHLNGADLLLNSPWHKFRTFRHAMCVDFGITTN